MIFNDHSPPHFHASYGDYKITVEIKTGIVNGQFPKRALKAVLEWYEIYQADLLEDWDLAQKHEILKKYRHWSSFMVEILEAKYSKEFRLWLKFNNGKSGEVDLKDHLWGPAFEPLKDVDYFIKFEVSKDLGTVVWPNEADFAPEFLLDNLYK